MLFSSSKRALSSTSTATCLPFRAASQQGVDHRRVLAHPVEGDLDGQHVGVAGGRLEEFDHRLERLVRMVQQDVSPLDDVEDLSPCHALQTPRRSGDESRVFQVGPVEFVQHAQAAHRQRHLDAVDVVRADPEVRASMSRMRSGMARSITSLTTEPKRRRLTLRSTVSSRSSAASPGWRCRRRGSPGTGGARRSPCPGRVRSRLAATTCSIHTNVCAAPPLPGCRFPARRRPTGAGCSAP